MFEMKEKKVEYLELVYDLIFVYMLGRNNSLLNNFENGFVSLDAFLAYIICTLAIIQIWNFTTFYVNMFGQNGIRDHIFLCVNMYLMYFIGESTKSNCQAYQTQYHIAWGLILLNIGLQYLIELRNHKYDVWNRDIIRRMSATLFAESVLVFIAAIPYPAIGTIFSTLAIFCGILMTAISRKTSVGGQVDFMHLSERAMLYVVFTFGEMIIATASYFNKGIGIDWSVIYFSLMAFLIVVGLFLSYEVMYDHIINREGDFDGMLYLALHIFIIFSLNNITASLEFMREEEVAVFPKVLFLVVSLSAYFFFLFSLRGYSKPSCRPGPRLLLSIAGLTIIFIVSMILCRHLMALNIFISVFYVFAVFVALFRLSRAVDPR